MGCPVCQGHAHQVCSAPGCRDETKDVAHLEKLGLYENISKTTNRGWSELPPPAPPPKCDLCERWARWGHPQGGLRCDVCPRPKK